MSRPSTAPNPRKHGFALVVVLFSLAILTLMFSAASTRTLASLQFSSGEVLASERFQARVELLDALVTLGLPEGDTFIWAGQTVRLQSTGGLVDLNAAAPELLERLLIGYGLPPTRRADALQAYRTWRRSGWRIQRVSDFARITGLDPAEIPDLKTLATVHSGRSTLSAEQATDALLAHLTGQTGSRDILIGLLPPALLGPATRSGFAVFDGADRLGVVSFGATADQNRILAVN